MMLRSTSDGSNSIFSGSSSIWSVGNSEEGLQMHNQQGEEQACFVRGSPIVPGSVRKIAKEGEYSLYTLVTLKGVTTVKFTPKIR